MCVCVHTGVCARRCARVRACVCVCTHMHVHTHACIPVCTWVWVFVHMHTQCEYANRPPRTHVAQHANKCFVHFTLPVSLTERPTQLNMNKNKPVYFALCFVTGS